MSGNINNTLKEEAYVTMVEHYPFKIHSDFEPQGDQPQAIKEIVEGIKAGKRHQTLLGATGTGKHLR